MKYILIGIALFVFSVEKSKANDAIDRMNVLIASTKFAEFNCPRMAIRKVAVEYAIAKAGLDLRKDLTTTTALRSQAAVIASLEKDPSTTCNRVYSWFGPEGLFEQGIVTLR